MNRLKKILNIWFFVFENSVQKREESKSRRRKNSARVSYSTPGKIFTNEVSCVVCRCARSDAKIFNENYDCVNSILDGCVAKMGSDSVCRDFIHAITPEQFAKNAHKLCPKTILEHVAETSGQTTKIFFGFSTKYFNCFSATWFGIGAVLLILSVTIVRKMRNSEIDHTQYEQLI